MLGGPAWRLWPRSTVLRVLLLATIGLYLLLAFQQAHQLYVIDEAEFPYIAQATAKSGLPIYYHGEVRPADVGTFHPPLYVYLLAAWIQMFGASHEAVRGFGIVCELTTAAFVAATVRLLFPRRADLLGVLAVALFLLNPLVIASGLLPDIDGSVGVLSLAIALHVLVHIVVSPTPRWVEVLAAGGTFGLALSTKLTTPLALVPLLLVGFLVSRRSLVKALRDYVICLVIGVSLFLAWWGALAALTSLQFSYPFQFTWNSFTAKSGSVPLSTRITALRPDSKTTFWFDPVLMITTALTGLVALIGWRSPRARAVVLLAVFTAGTIAAYDVITPPVFRFPKYWIAAVPAATIVCIAALGWCLERQQVSWRRSWSPPVLAGSLLAVFAMATIVLQRAIAVTPDRAPPLDRTAVFAFALSFTVVLLVALSQQGPRLQVVALPLIGATLLGVFVHGAALASIQRSADYSTRYYYGEPGFAQAVSDLRGVARNGGAVMAAKDIGFESGVPFFEDAFYLPDPVAMRTLLDSGRVQYAVTRLNYDYSEPVFPAAFAVLREYMTPVVQRPGSDFVVWRLTRTGDKQ